jgi:hypothetical protein
VTGKKAFWVVSLRGSGQLRQADLSTARPDIVRVADDPGIIDKGYAVCVTHPMRTRLGIIRKFAHDSFGSRQSIPANDMIQKGRTRGGEF